MKTIVAIFGLSLACSISASPLYVCPPDLTQDGIEVTPGCPGLSYQITVESGTSFFASFNDNPLSQGISTDGGTGDSDFQDAWITGEIVSTGNPLLDAVYIEWGGSLSSWTNSIQVGIADASATNTGILFAGYFLAGTDLPLIGWTNNGGSPEEGYSNFPALNPGGADHFYESQSTSTPEPSSAWVLVAGLGLVLCASSRRNTINRRR